MSNSEQVGTPTEATIASKNVWRVACGVLNPDKL